MAGLGIQKKGTSKILMKRKGFVEGGDVDETFEQPIGKVSPKMAKELEMAEYESGARSAQKNLDEFNRKMEGMKTPKQRREEIIKNRKSEEIIKKYPVPKMKKGGSVKKGILIVIGEKDKKSKEMKKAGKKPKGMK